MKTDRLPSFHHLYRPGRYLIPAFFGLYTLFILIGWLVPDWGGSASTGLALHLQDFTIEQLRNMSLLQRLTGLLCAMPALLALGRAVHALHWVLLSFERGEFFSTELTHRYRQFTACLFIGTLLTIVEPILRSLLFSFFHHGEALKLTIDFDFSAADLWNLLLCAIFYLTTPALLEGRRLAEENREFI